MSDIWQGRNNEGDIVVSPMNNGLFSYSYVENPTKSFEIGAKELCDFFEPKNPKGGNQKDQGRKADAPKAVQILNKAVSIMAERGKSYDRSGGEAERSMPKIVAMFNALTGHELTPEQGWKFMCCLKLATSEQGEYREDNYLDGAAYMALAGEEASEAASE